MHKLLLMFTLYTASLFSAAHEPKELFALIKRGNIRGAQDLLNANTKWLETTNSSGQTPLCIALINARTHIVRDLIEIRKANVNTRDNQGNPLFYYAIQHVYLRKEYCLLLLENGHNATQALITAAEYNFLEMVELILKKSVNVNEPDSNNITAIEAAAGNNHAAIVKLLIEYGADKNIHSGLGKGPIGWGAYYKNRYNKPELAHILSNTQPIVKHILPCNPITFLLNRETGTSHKKSRKRLYE